MKRILEVKKKIGTLSKNSKNPFFKSQYLDLHSLLEAVEPLLQEQGLILLQPIIDNKVVTRVVSCDEVLGGTIKGETVEYQNILCESSIQLPDEPNPQKLGMAITYFRRYTLTSLLAISETDDDGNGASKKKVFTEKIAKEEKKKGTAIGMLVKAFDMTPEQVDKYNKL
jgi:hypothetical protein|tara:strand:- start:366 stop:872 length:507 start_codon:yes stop_codon:yes gene_type:complete